MRQSTEGEASRPIGAKSPICSRPPVVVRAFISPCRLSSSGQVLSDNRLTSAPTESTVLLALVLVRATSSLIRRTASDALPSRSICGPSCSASCPLKRVLLFKVRAALSIPESIESLCAASVCARSDRSVMAEP